MYELPVKISINNQEYQIRKNGDYRLALDCLEIMSDDELDGYEKAVNLIAVFYEDVEEMEDIYRIFGTVIQEAIDKAVAFLDLNENKQGFESPHKLIDWKQDEPLITSAINTMLHEEIRVTPYMHWWTFVGYYMGIGESSLSTIVGIRNKLATGKKLDKSEREIISKNPQYFSWSNERPQTEEEKQIISMWYGEEG